jgi:hypothetical protein
MAYPADDIAPPGYKPHSLGIPEFRIHKYKDGREELQVRYVASDIGYTGLWMKVDNSEETVNGDSKTSST